MYYVSILLTPCIDVGGGVKGRSIRTEDIGAEKNIFIAIPLARTLFGMARV